MQALLKALVVYQPAGLLNVLAKVKVEFLSLIKSWLNSPDMGKVIYIDAFANFSRSTALG